MPVQRFLAENAARDHAEFSYLQRRRTATASAVGLVWRIVRRGIAFDRVEAASAERICRGRARHVGAGGIRRLAELLYRILHRHQSEDRGEGTDSALSRFWFAHTLCDDDSQRE